MANSVGGGQLTTYNPNITYFTSTTAGTSGVVVYSVEAGVGQNAGITNTPPAGYVYDGMSHFANIAGKHGTYIGDPGNEIPLTDKQETVVATLTNSSASSVAWAVVPFQCTMSGYVTNANASGAIPAGATNVLVYSGSSASGGLLATITLNTTGGPGDTYTWYCATSTTVIPGGQPISFNFNTTASGTAYSALVTAVLTRVGI